MPGVRGRPQDPEWVRKRIEARRRTIAAKPDFYKTFSTSHEVTPSMRQAISQKRIAYYQAHPEAREALRQARLGTTQTKESNRKRRQALLGREFSEELRKKISDALQAEKHPNWQGGITPINHRLRNNYKYKLWRKSVLQRDNFTCLVCGQVGGELNADHIKQFSRFPLLRYELTNGATLCVACHF